MHKTLTSSAGSFLGGLSEALGAEGVSATMTMEPASPLAGKNSEDKHSCMSGCFVAWFVGSHLQAYLYVKMLFQRRGAAALCPFALVASARTWSRTGLQAKPSREASATRSAPCFLGCTSMGPLFSPTSLCFLYAAVALDF